LWKKKFAKLRESPPPMGERGGLLGEDPSRAVSGHDQWAHRRVSMVSPGEEGKGDLPGGELSKRLFLTRNASEKGKRRPYGEGSGLQPKKVLQRKCWGGCRPGGGRRKGGALYYNRKEKSLTVNSILDKEGFAKRERRRFKLLVKKRMKSPPEKESTLGGDLLAHALTMFTRRQRGSQWKRGRGVLLPGWGSRTPHFRSSGGVFLNGRKGNGGKPA